MIVLVAASDPTQCVFVKLYGWLSSPILLNISTKQRRDALNTEMRVLSSSKSLLPSHSNVGFRFISILRPKVTEVSQERENIYEPEFTTRDWIGQFWCRTTESENKMKNDYIIWWACMMSSRERRQLNSLLVAHIQNIEWSTLIRICNSNLLFITTITF